jgi:hypothetical protein
VSGIADRFNGHIDEFLISHIQVRRLDRDHRNNMNNPGAFAVAGGED